MSDRISPSSTDSQPPADANLAHRYADALTAASYPLPCDTRPLAFVEDPNEEEPKRWRVDIPLANFDPGTLVIPSYTQLDGQNYRTQFELLHGASQSSLPCVPSATQVPRTSTAVTSSELPGISTHIDYWLINTATPELMLRLWLTGSCPSTRYLLKLSIRPQRLPGELRANLFDSAKLLGQPEVAYPLSQKLGPNNIRGGICSPTATAMAMAQLSAQQSSHWPSFVSACRDGATGMYGVWPLNLYQAGRRGFLGAIETPTTHLEVHQILRAQLPLVTSIAYSKGGLTNAPQEQTSGHLVLLHGIQDGKALVSDPAALTTAEVHREYALEQFLEAWLRNRGACYLMLPKA